MDFIGTLRSDLVNSTILKFFTGLDKLVNQSAIDENNFNLIDKTVMPEMDDRTTDSSDTEMDADDDHDRHSIKNVSVSAL